MTHRRRRRQIREWRQGWRRGGLDVVIVLPTGGEIEELRIDFVKGRRAGRGRAS